MSDYFCHECALRLNKYTPVDPDELNLTGSQYQLNKFIKHTTPITYAGIVSVFDDAQYDQYKQFTINTSISGSMEIDNNGRSNIIWYAGKDVGIKYDNGIFVSKTDTVKVVLHDNAIKIHTFSEDSFKYETKKCKECGIDILC